MKYVNKGKESHLPLAFVLMQYCSRLKLVPISAKNGRSYKFLAHIIYMTIGFGFLSYHGIDILHGRK